MDALRIERLRVPPGLERTRGARLRARAWREWCFYRAVGQQLWRQGLAIALLLALGAILFRALEPRDGDDLGTNVYYTWSLIFGQPPESFPKPWPLRAMFFLVPVIGLVVIVESIVQFAGMLRDRQRAERPWCRIMAKAMTGHIVLVGVGRLGYRVFTLLRRLGRDVVVIEANPTNQFLEDVRRDGSPLLIGDARREAVLEDANIRNAAAIILATTDDLANLEIALDARRAVPGIRVVMRMFDEGMADKVREGFNIKLAMSQSSLSAPTFAIKAIEPATVSSVVVGDRLVVTVRWSVGGDGAGPGPGAVLVGRTVGDVMREHGCGVVERRTTAGASTLFPAPETVLESGDALLVQGPYEVVLRRPAPHG